MGQSEAYKRLKARVAAWDFAHPKSQEKDQQTEQPSDYEKAAGLRGKNSPEEDAEQDQLADELRRAGDLLIK